MPCACESASWEDPQSRDYKRLVAAFDDIRNACPAIRKVIVPDSEWKRFKEFCAGKTVEGAHKPVLLLGFKRGYLARLTSPIHRYLLSGQDLKSNVTPQYRADLVERWMHSSDVFRRQERAKKWMGKITELQCAEWLEVGMGWGVRDLEATGGVSDIDAATPTGDSVAVEVKYFGPNENGFKILLEAIKKGHAIGSGNLYTACDYVLARVYEAAVRLMDLPRHRIVIIAIDSGELRSHLLQFQTNWIDWDAPAFSKHPQFLAFLSKLKRKHPNVEEDLAEKIRTLSEVWILTKWNRPDLSLFEWLLRKDFRENKVSR